MPTIEQIRAARALLDWSQSDLAEYAGLSQTGIARIENGTNQPNTTTLNKIKAAFENADIEFLGENGLRRKTGEVRIHRGENGFRAFMDDVYTVISEQGGEICVYNVDEKNWIRWMGKEGYSSHALRMKEIKRQFQFRIIVKEGDEFLIASDFAEYRWFPQNMFRNQSFYAYGSKLALIDFKENNVEVMMLDQKDFTESFRILFNIAWDHVAKKTSK